MDIKEKFLELTSRTYPHGEEDKVIPLLGIDYQKDKHGNLFVKIGDSDVMFTSHLDTATKQNKPVKHKFKDNIIKTDGNSILGADDKAGVTIMLYMIENKVPGLYYFFLGEEVGCVGSKKLAKDHKKEKIKGINKVISFDRRGTKSVITHQSWVRCTSDKFADELAKQLNSIDDTFEYDKDDTGVLTDSVQFVDIYPECTNISVGYQNEHTNRESQDIEHLIKLAKACVKVDWKSLPAERDPSVTEYSDGGYWDYYYSSSKPKKKKNKYKYEEEEYQKNYLKTRNKSITNLEDIYIYDTKYKYLSILKYDRYGDMIEVDLHSDRIKEEEVLIKALLKELELNFSRIEWDGVILNVYYPDGNLSSCDRNDLLVYIPILDYSKHESQLDESQT
jgi:hypothetical protein